MTSAADTSMEQNGDPPNLPNLFASVATATGEELSILKCTNCQEVVAHKKHLTETAIRHFQRGLDTRPEDPLLKNVMPQLIQDFKTAIMAVYDPARKANCKEVWKCIEDPEAEYIWNPPNNDDYTQDEPAEASVQQHEQPHIITEEFIQALEEPLTDKQALIITDLFRSHTCMLG